jgi:hypothetical protein
MRLPHRPHIVLAWVSGCDCLKILRKHLRGLLEDVSFSTRLRMWFQHDGPPPHCSRENMSVAARKSSWMMDRSRGLDFPGLGVHLIWILSILLLGYLKIVVYASKAHTKRATEASNSTICEWNKEYARKLRTLASSVSRRPDPYVHEHGDTLLRKWEKKGIGCCFVFFLYITSGSIYGVATEAEIITDLSFFTEGHMGHMHMNLFTNTDVHKQSCNETSCLYIYVL